MKENIHESMIYGYMLNESFIEDLKAKNIFYFVEGRLNYFKNNKEQPCEMYYKELINQLNKLNYDKLSSSNKAKYNKLKKDIDNWAASYLKEKKEKEKYLAKERDEKQKFLAKFEDAPDWNEDNLNEVINYINTKVIKTLLTPEYKKMVQKVINDAITKDPDMYDEKIGWFPKIKAKDFDGFAIEILDASQMMRVELCRYITQPIADIFGANTGDGDEGCIYR